MLLSPLLSLLALLVALSATQTPNNTPLSFSDQKSAHFPPITAQSPSLTIYSKEINTFTCAVSGTSATWLGTRLGVKRIDRATGAIRVYGAANGLPWSIVVQVATDDEGKDAAALVLDPATAFKKDPAFLLCLYDSTTDHWHIIDHLPIIHTDWYEALGKVSAQDVQLQHLSSLPYRIALTKHYVLLANLVNPKQSPVLLNRYERATGKPIEPLPWPKEWQSDYSFLLIRSICRHEETLYLATQIGLVSVDIETGRVHCDLSNQDILRIAIPPISMNKTKSPPTLWAIGLEPHLIEKYVPSDSGLLTPFDLKKRKVAAEPIFLKGTGVKDSWNDTLCVGEDSYPYLIRRDSFTRYEPVDYRWQHFDNAGNTFLGDTPPQTVIMKDDKKIYLIASQTVIPDTVAQERNWSKWDISSTGYYDPDLTWPWLQSRFPRWISRGIDESILQTKSLPPFPYAADPGNRHISWGVKDNTLLQYRSEDLEPLRYKFADPPKPQQSIPISVKVASAPLHIYSLDTLHIRDGINNWNSVTIAVTDHGALEIKYFDPIEEAVLWRWISEAERKDLEDANDRSRYSPPQLPIDHSPLPSDWNLPADTIMHPIVKWYENLLCVDNKTKWFYSYDLSLKKWNHTYEIPHELQPLILTAGTNLSNLSVTQNIAGDLIFGNSHGLWWWGGDYMCPIKISPLFKAVPDRSPYSWPVQISLQQIAADKDAFFLSAKNADDIFPCATPILLRYEKRTGKTEVLTEDNSGIASMQGNTSDLCFDGEAVWMTFRKKFDRRYRAEEIGGAYRWNQKKERFDCITTSAILALQVDPNSKGDVYLLTPTKLLHWQRKGAKLTELSLNNDTDRQKIPLQAQLVTKTKVYVLGDGFVKAWDKHTHQWQTVAQDLPLFHDYFSPPSMWVSQDKLTEQLWIDDTYTKVKITLPQE